MNGAEEARLLTSPLRIVWQHGQNWPNYKLTVTAYGEGDVCNQEGRHPCLKLGRQSLVCIKDELLCDGVQNCPVGKEFESDESEAVCEMVKKKEPWMEIIKDLLKKIPTLRSHNNGSSIEEGPHPEQPHHHHQATSFTLAGGKYNKTIYVETVIETNPNIRQNFPKGLSKYGPWGYLMLGMLLCGGALLVCGLWGEIPRVKW